jgi:hypothetical protein
MFENDELTDRELDHLLKQWHAPGAPEGLGRFLLGPPKPWYSRLWTASIRIPLPVAAVMLLLLGFLVVQLRRAELPPAAIENAPLGFKELHPVAEFKPRIIRGASADN